MLKTRIIVMVMFYALAQAAIAQTETNIFTAADVFELEFANDPRVSPDGEQIIYERRSNDIMKDSSLSQLWMTSVDGRRHRPIVSSTESATSPRWSPDGERIAYVQATASGTGIHVRWMDNGQTALLANLQESPAELAWSPDGRSLAFVMKVAAEVEQLVSPRKAPEGAEWSEPVKVIDTASYRWDGQGFLEPAYEHIFVIPADGGSPRQITSGDFNHGGPVSWTPDGGAILFSSNRDEGWELVPGQTNIFSVSVNDGELTQLTDRPGSEDAPVMSPNGRYIAYVYDSNEKISYRTQTLFLMDADGSGSRELSEELDHSVNNLQWAGDRQIYFQYDERAVRKVGRSSLTGELTEVVIGLGSTSLGRPYLSGSYTVSDNGTIAYTHGSEYRPAEVAVAGRRDARILTALNEDLLGNRTLGSVHEIIYNSSYDQQEIQGWYITPPDFDETKQYPLILEIHGGPFAAYGPYFSAEMQLMAAAGYIVFYDNHRGSTSYGTDFAMLLHENYSSPYDFADHMSGVDAVIEQGNVSADNLFVTGGSAGGIASAYAIGLTDRFSAAAVAKPVVNWISKTLTADSYIGQIYYQFPGMPWEHLEHYWKRSPLSLVGNMTTPTMLITGEEDYRTPISETEQLYQALKLKGVDVVMVRVPGSPHGIAGKPSRLVAKVDNILAWFARYRSDLGIASGE